MRQSNKVISNYNYKNKDRNINKSTDKNTIDQLNFNRQSITKIRPDSSNPVTKSKFKYSQNKSN